MRVLRLRHGRHRVTHMDGQLADIDEGVLVGRDGIHGVQLRHAVPHHDKGLAVVFVVHLPALDEGEIYNLPVRRAAVLSIPSAFAPSDRHSGKPAFEATGTRSGAPSRSQRSGTENTSLSAVDHSFTRKRIYLLASFLLMFVCFSSSMSRAEPMGSSCVLVPFFQSKKRLYFVVFE